MSVTPSALVAALRDWYATPVAYEPDGKPWHSHTTSGGWAPIGILHHHTGGSSKLLTDRSTQLGMLRMLRNGRPDLDGPLCHLAPAMVPGTRTAVVHLIGWGNCNHAGRGCQTNSGRVRGGTYAGAAPGPDVVDGNSLLWGLEYLHPGTSLAWPDALLEVGHRAACAIAEVSGWSRPSWPGSNLEHREWTRRKIDRSWRGDLRAAIRATALAGTGPVTTPAAPQPPQEEQDMPTADEIGSAVTGTWLGRSGPTVGVAIQDTHALVKQTAEAVKVLTEQVASLGEAVARLAEQQVTPPAASGTPVQP